MNTTRYAHITFPEPKREPSKSTQPTKTYINVEDFNYIHALRLHKKSLNHTSKQVAYLNSQHNNNLAKMNHGWEIKVAGYRKEVENYMRLVYEWQRAQKRQADLINQQMWLVLRDLQQQILDMSYRVKSQDVGLGRFHPGMNAVNFVNRFKFFMTANNLPNNPSFLIRTFLHFMEGSAYDWGSTVLGDSDKYYLFHRDFNMFLKDFVARF